MGDSDSVLTDIRLSNAFCFDNKSFKTFAGDQKSIAPHFLMHSNLIQERTMTGLSAARARGRLGGRPKILNADKQQLAVQLYEAKKTSVKIVCEMLEISKPTLYAYIRANAKR